MVPLRSIFLLCVSYKIRLNIGPVYTSFLIYDNWLVDWEINLRTIKHVQCNSRKYQVHHDGLIKSLSKTLRDESQLGAYVMMQISIDTFSPSEHAHTPTYFRIKCYDHPPELTQFFLFFGVPLSTALRGVNFIVSLIFGSVIDCCRRAQSAKTRPHAHLFTDQMLWSSPSDTHNTLELEPE